MLSYSIPIFLIISSVKAQGYGDTPEPVKTVTSAPIHIDCGTPPAPKLFSFADLFTTTAASYQTAPLALPKIPTLQELFPPAPIAIHKNYEVGPPSAQPYAPSRVTNEEDDDNDESLLNPEEPEQPEISEKEEKTRSKLDKLRRRMHGIKSMKFGSIHHLDLHNHHHIRNRHN